MTVALAAKLLWKRCSEDFEFFQQVLQDVISFSPQHTYQQERMLKACKKLHEHWRNAKSRPCVENCREARAQGRGPCGACALCYSEVWKRLDKLEHAAQKLIDECWLDRGSSYERIVVQRNSTQEIPTTFWALQEALDHARGTQVPRNG